MHKNIFFLTSIISFDFITQLESNILIECCIYFRNNLFFSVSNIVACGFILTLPNENSKTHEKFKVSKYFTSISDVYSPYHLK